MVISNADKFNEIIKSIKDLGESMTTRIDNLENRLTGDYVRLESKIVEEIGNVRSDLSKEIQTIQKACATNTNVIEDNKKEVDLKMQSLSEENTRLTKAVSKLEMDAELSVKKMIHLERTVNGGLQHGRKWNIELDGIPNEVGDEPTDLENAVVKILTGMNVFCEADDIQAIHRLPNKTGATKSTIVRFNSRKTSESALSNKMKLKNLKDMQLDIPGLKDDSQIYIRPSLCPYYRTLQYNGRLLKKHL